MPFYDYMCEMCDEIWEEDLPMGFRGLVTCPICKSGHSKRLVLSAPATVLNWWNARASSDTDGITKRYRPRVDSKMTTKRDRRRRGKQKEMAHEYD